MVQYWALVSLPNVLHIHRSECRLSAQTIEQLYLVERSKAVVNVELVDSVHHVAGGDEVSCGFSEWVPANGIVQHGIVIGVRSSITCGDPVSITIVEERQQ